MAGLVIRGQVVSLADPNAAPQAIPGAVWIADGLVVAVTAADAAGPVGFDNAAVVDVADAFVLPGFVDLHNHMGYNALPLWNEPSQKQPFRHNGDWPNADTYSESVTWPAWCLATAAPEALLAYIQVRALVGGAAVQQGWPTANRATDRVLRNVDSDGGTDTKRDPILTSVVTKNDDGLKRTAQQIRNDVGFIYHCAEGQPASAVAKQFDAADTAGCLLPTFVGVHCCAVTREGWTRWATQNAGGVAWSPFSNYWLYGLTTTVDAARAQGVKVCLGCDWGPSGTKNLLGELKVARLASDHEGFGLSDDDLLAMITSNPGDLLARCWKTPVGRLVPGALGDVTVIHRRTPDSVASNVVRATESDVALVVVGGVARYGETKLMQAAAATGTSKVTVAGIARAVALPPRRSLQADAPPTQWTWAKILGELEAVRKNPVAAVKAAEDRRNAFAGPIDDSIAPLILSLDMPGGANTGFAGRPKDLTAVKIPPIETLEHDTSFFDRVDKGGFHNGLLSPLRSFFP